MIRVIGNHVSPYGRKALVALVLKGIAHEVDPIVPFMGTDAFTALSPLRRIPVLIDGDFVLNDSTVICEYLDEVWPEPPLLPKAPRDRAKARWIEEWCDSRLGDLVIWRLFFQRVVRPMVFKVATDEALVARTIGEDLPAACDWLEGQAPDAGFLFDAVGTADVIVAAFFRNALIAGFEPDPNRWPRIVAWLAAVNGVPAFARSVVFEQATLAARKGGGRAALEAAGMRLAAETVGGREARAGVMPLG